jgi:hypothetical protein
MPEKSNEFAITITPPSESGKTVVKKSGVREGDATSNNLNASYGRRAGSNTQVEEWLSNQANQVRVNVCNNVAQMSLSEPK